jgi:hypothetical protein
LPQNFLSSPARSNVEHYWTHRNKDYAVALDAKNLIREGISPLEVGLNHDTRADYEYASLKYAEGLQIIQKAMLLVPVDCVVGKLLDNHWQAFSRRKEEIDFFYKPKTLFDFPTAPSAPPPAGAVTTAGLTLV